MKTLGSIIFSLFFCLSLGAANKLSFFDEESPGVVFIQQGVRIQKADISDEKLFELLVKKFGIPLFDGSIYLPLNSGSGFFIDKQGHLLTNWHVINPQNTKADQAKGYSFWIWYIEKNFTEEEMSAEDKFKLEKDLVRVFPQAETKTLVLVNNHVFFDSKTLAFDIKDDLALLEIDYANTNCFVLGLDNYPEVGSDVYSLGYPLGMNSVQNFRNLTVSFTKGSISAIRDGILSLEHTATINHGNSGGPLTDTSGKVLGINTAQRTTENNMYYALPNKLIREFLLSHKYEKFLGSDEKK